ncbi:hypothetical protein LCGC14_2075290 [marine sediment metagenome]|uniref:Class I SAM-dependent methyltransferase n=1 Tax=marine sediment metagenome TaxID=412755 RepID=A0A0F9F4K7_9ZZZZ
MVRNRRDWLATLPENSVGAEIGVMEGQFSRVILDVARPERLFLVDHWTSALPGEKGAKRHAEQAVRLRTTLREVCKEIATGQVRLVVAFSVEAAGMLGERSLDWVYIDAHHSYQAVTEDLEAWFPKVKLGGVIAGHDYQKECVVKAVYDFTRDKKLTPVEVTTDPFPAGRNPPPSFFFTKLG